MPETVDTTAPDGSDVRSTPAPNHRPATPRGDTAAMVVLVLAVALWIAIFGHLVVLKHSRLGSLDFDMGIHDQSVWLLAHFRGFLTVRGLQVFGHHATPGYLLYVPFSWLGAGVDFLNVSMVVVTALGAVPVFLLARHRTRNAWIATTLGVVFLLHPALQFFMAELFHPEVMAITPLLCAYYCSVRRRWVWFSLWVVLAVCWKEDVALAIVVLGLIVALRGDRRIGLITAAAALAWFLVWSLGVFPLLDHGRIQSAALYSDVGGSPSGVARTLFAHPSRITARLIDPDARDYGWKLFAPFGFVGLAAPLTLLVGLPQAFLNLVTNVPWTKTISFHYAAVPLVAVTIASVEAVSWIVRRTTVSWGRVLVVAWVAAAALLATTSWGPSPIGSEYRHDLWPLSAPARLTSGREALHVVPDGAAVSASYNLVAQLSERAEIYSFPNPWETRNFGIDGWPRRDPARVQWLVVDRAVLGPPDRALLDRVLGSKRFRVVFDRDGYVVAQRIRRA